MCHAEIAVADSMHHCRRKFSTHRRAGQTAEDTWSRKWLRTRLLNLRCGNAVDFCCCLAWATVLLNDFLIVIGITGIRHAKPVA